MCESAGVEKKSSACPSKSSNAAGRCHVIAANRTQVRPSPSAPTFLGPDREGRNLDNWGGRNVTETTYRSQQPQQQQLHDTRYREHVLREHRHIGQDLSSFFVLRQSHVCARGRYPSVRGRPALVALHVLRELALRRCRIGRHSTGPYQSSIQAVFLLIITLYC